MRFFWFLFVLALAGCATTPKQDAYVGASLDAISTEVAIKSGRFKEGNPLMRGSPVGIAGAFVAKAAIIEVESRIAPETIPVTSGVFNAVALHNIALIAGASTPAAWAIGIATGIIIYRKDTSDWGKQNEEQKREWLRNFKEN
jgi:hypothetical protein